MGALRTTMGRSIRRRGSAVRRLVYAALAFALIATEFSMPPASASTMSELIARACANDSHDVLLRSWHGMMPGRSGDIQIIPKFPNFVNTGLSHATPYAYTQDVPLLVYGPGYIRAGNYTKPVTLTDIAPTQGALLKFPFDAPDGTPQTQILDPNRSMPKLVVTLVWDSGGRDVTDTWKNDLPYFNSLIPKGAWFPHATVGASPSNTPPGHAEIGTGAFPMHNGYVDDWLRVADTVQQPTEAGPGMMVDPTFADLYDRGMDNKPVVGGVVSLSAHLAMMSHGSFWGGGDQDIAITRQFGIGATAGTEAPKWTLSDSMAPYYRFPGYANALPKLSTYTQTLDAQDGRIDGKWRTNSIDQLKGGFDTPARTPYQTTLVEAVVKREGFGKDDVPDLLYINYKAIDTIGHLFSLNSPEMSDTVKYQDEALRQLVEFLNTTVGRGKWVLFLTADHGTQYSPSVSHAFLIDIGTFTRDLIDRFDTDGDSTPMFPKIRPTQIWVDHAELDKNHVTLPQIAQYIDGLTQAETINAGTTPNPATANEQVFAAALPAQAWSHLPCLPEARQAG
jgi:Type I phosphodiesterase / nucleotide pyrophosphatase